MKTYGTNRNFVCQKEEKIADIHLLSSSKKHLIAQSLATYKNQIDFYQSALIKIEKELKNTSNELTQKRLLQIKKVNFANQSYYSHLGSILVEEADGLGLDDIQLSNSPGILDPIPTLNRDWGYGRHEVESEKQGCLKHFSDILKQTNDILFLGAGSCHLEELLVKEFSIKTAFALDISLELLLSYSEISRSTKILIGEELTSPVDIEHSTCLSEITKTEPSNLTLLYADFAQMPLKDESFHTIMTPWFLDVVPKDISWSLQRIFTLLKDNGHLLFMGPFGFDSQMFSQRYSPEEVKDIAQSTGFEILSHEREKIPYRQYPGIGRHSTEQVHYMALKKSK